MKILMLTSSYPKYEGDQTAPFIEAIAQHTQAAGHEVTVLMPYNAELRRQPVENGVRLHQFRYVPFKSWNIWGYAASMKGDIRIRKQVYLLLPLVSISSLWHMWKLTGRERFAMIQAHWVVPNAPLAVLIGLIRRIPVVISLHGSDVFVAERLKPAGWVARWAFKRAAAVTASSEDLMSRAQKLGAPVEPKRGVVIPYGVDPGEFRPLPANHDEIRAVLGFQPDEQILFCIGRLVYKKGFEYAIRAMPEVLKKFPRAKLVIAGKGDLRAELEKEASRAGVAGHVRFEGMVPHNRVTEYLAASDIFLLPSVVDKEGNVDGLPNTLVEALATGKPVIASRVAGVPLAVDDGINGRLVPPGNPHALADAICEVLADPDLQARFGRAARAKIEQELNWKNIVRRYIAVFEVAVPPQTAQVR